MKILDGHLWINTSLQPSCPHPASKRALRPASMGISSARGFLLCSFSCREATGGEASGCQGSLGLCLELGCGWKPGRCELHNSDQSKFTHSQLSDGTLNLHSVRGESLFWLFLNLKTCGKLRDGRSSPQPPEHVKVTFYGKDFADIIKDLQMGRLSWIIHVDPK